MNRPTLHGIILGGSLGNMTGGVALIVGSYSHDSVLMLVLGAAAVACGAFVYEAEQEAEKRRNNGDEQEPRKVLVSDPTTGTKWIDADDPSRTWSPRTDG